MSSIIVQWVVDPLDENTREAQTMINSIIDTGRSGQFELMEKTSLANGLIRYKYQLNDVEADQSYGIILQLLVASTLNPITFSLEDEELDHDEIKFLIGKTVKQHLGIRVDSVTVIRYQHHVDFIPYDQHNNRIYCTVDQLADISEDLIRECISCKRECPDENGEAQFNKRFMREYCSNQVMVLPSQEYGQICELWELGCNKRSTGELVVVTETNRFANQEFINHAAHYMRQGMVPRITFYGPWQLRDFSQAPFIEYAAVRAYLEDDHGLAGDIRVQNDLSVTVPILDIIQYRNFESNFYRHLKNYKQYHFIDCEDMIDAVIKRYHLCEKYQDCESLVVSMRGIDRIGRKIVTKIENPTFNFEADWVRLTNDLREYFKLCKHLVVDTDLSQMKLEQLLQIAHVHISTDSNQMVCFDSNILHLFPEISRIGRFGDIQSRLSGCYDFGPVKGIKSRMPTRYNNIQVDLDVDYLSQDHDGTVVEVTVISIKGEPILITPDLDVFKLDQLAEKGWHQGWFFNELGMALARRGGHPFHTTWLAPIDLIQQGIDLLSDGQDVSDVMETFLEG